MNPSYAIGVIRIQVDWVVRRAHHYARQLLCLCILILYLCILIVPAGTLRLP